MRPHDQSKAEGRRDNSPPACRRRNLCRLRGGDDGRWKLRAFEGRESGIDEASDLIRRQRASEQEALHRRAAELLEHMLVSEEEVSSLPWLWAVWALSSWTSALLSVAG